jgi:hypothetical protein
MEILVDGTPLKWTCRKNLDRNFYEWAFDHGFSEGEHTLEVRQLTPPKTDRIRQLCSVNIYEYGSPEEFNSDPSHVSFYPTWDIDGTKHYRPTSESCLMRNMTTNQFCSVCKEGMWRSFLSKISLIDSVNVECHASGHRATVVPLKLAQFRQNGIISGEKYTVVWTKNKKRISEFDDLFTITIPASESAAEWKVKVVFETPEVRYDPDNALITERTFSVKC